MNQFIKLTRHNTLNPLLKSNKVLINLNKVTDIYSGQEYSTVYLADLDSDGEQLKVHVKETLNIIQKRIGGF